MTRFPVYSDAACLTVISIAPLPRAGFVATHVPTHLPVMSTVGATVAGPTPLAQPAVASTTRTSMIHEDFFIGFLRALVDPFVALSLRGPTRAGTRTARPASRPGRPSPVPGRCDAWRHRPRRRPRGHAPAARGRHAP